MEIQGGGGPWGFGQIILRGYLGLSENLGGSPFSYFITFIAFLPMWQFCFRTLPPAPLCATLHHLNNNYQYWCFFAFFDLVFLKFNQVAIVFFLFILKEFQCFGYSTCNLDVASKVVIATGLLKFWKQLLSKQSSRPYTKGTQSITIFLEEKNSFYGTAPLLNCH